MKMPANKLALSLVDEPDRIDAVSMMNSGEVVKISGEFSFEEADDRMATFSLRSIKIGKPKAVAAGSAAEPDAGKEKAEKWIERKREKAYAH